MTIRAIMEAIRQPKDIEYVYTPFDKNHRRKDRVGFYTIKPIDSALFQSIQKSAPKGSLAKSSYCVKTWDDRYTGYCLLDGQNIIGYVIVKKENSWIMDLEVFPDYKGMGYGDMLVDLGKQLGGKYLTCVNINTVAWKLYENKGFVVMKKDGQITYMKLNGEPDGHPPNDY